MMANKLDMYGLVSYRKVQLLVYWLCWLYPCHHENFFEHYTCVSLHSTALHCTALYYVPQYYNALNCTALHYNALHYTALHYIALHFTILCCTAHYWTPMQ